MISASTSLSDLGFTTVSVLLPDAVVGLVEDWPWRNARTVMSMARRKPKPMKTVAAMVRFPVKWICWQSLASPVLYRLYSLVTATVSQLVALKPNGL